MQLGSVTFILGDGLSEGDRLIQMAHTLLSSFSGSFVCHRDMGINPDIIDCPLPLATAKYVADAHDNIERFIPQLNVDNIEFDNREEALLPVVYLSINDEYEYDMSESDMEEEVGEEDEYERD